MAKFVKREITKVAHVTGGVAVGGAVLYALYETFEWVKYRLWKSKNPTTVLTFNQYKAGRHTGAIK